MITYYKSLITSIRIVTSNQTVEVPDTQFTLSNIEGSDTWVVEFPIPDNSTIRSVSFLQGSTVLSTLSVTFATQVDMRFTYRFKVRNGGRIE